MPAEFIQQSEAERNQGKSFISSKLGKGAGDRFEALRTHYKDFGDVPPTGGDSTVGAPDGMNYAYNLYVAGKKLGIDKPWNDWELADITAALQTEHRVTDLSELNRESPAKYPEFTAEDDEDDEDNEDAQKAKAKEYLTAYLVDYYPNLVKKEVADEDIKVEAGPADPDAPKPAEGVSASEFEKKWNAHLSTDLKGKYTVCQVKDDKDISKGFSVNPVGHPNDVPPLLQVDDKGTIKVSNAAFKKHNIPDADNAKISLLASTIKANNPNLNETLVISKGTLKQREQLKKLLELQGYNNVKIDNTPTAAEQAKNKKTPPPMPGMPEGLSDIPGLKR